MIGFEAQSVIGLDRVVAGILKFVGEQLVHQADAAAFLKLINQNAGAVLGNLLQRKVQLIAAVAAAGAENIAGQALRMDANERRVLRREVAHHQRQDAFGFVFGFETEEPEGPKSASAGWFPRPSWLS